MASVPDRAHDPKRVIPSHRIMPKDVDLVHWGYAPGREGKFEPHPDADPNCPSCGGSGVSYVTNGEDYAKNLCGCMEEHTWLNEQK